MVYTLYKGFIESISGGFEDMFGFYYTQLIYCSLIVGSIIITYINSRKHFFLGQVEIIRLRVNKDCNMVSFTLPPK